MLNPVFLRGDLLLYCTFTKYSGMNTLSVELLERSDPNFYAELTQQLQNAYLTTIDTALQHLEQQFALGMSWQNHGEWHIDHINFVFPKNELTLTLDVHGTIVGLAHGHQVKGSAESWWGKQAFGMQPIGDEIEIDGQTYVCADIGWVKVEDADIKFLPSEYGLGAVFSVREKVK